MDKHEYSAGILMKVFGIARNTLRYYEQLGLVNPERNDDSGYRVYTNEDVSSVFAAGMLRNSGMSLGDAADLINSAERPFDLVLAAKKANAERELLTKAVGESLDMLEECIAAASKDEIKLCKAGGRCVFYDGAEDGYASFDGDGSLDGLLECYPISSLTSIHTSADGVDELRFGRSIPLDHHDTVKQFLKGRTPDYVFEGGPCVRMAGTATLDALCDRDRVRRSYQSCFDKAGEYAKAHHLALNGTGVSAGYMVGDRMYFFTYIPVRAAGVFGRAALLGIG